MLFRSFRVKNITGPAYNSGTDATVIMANFFIVDDGDRVLRDISGDINKSISLATNESKVLTVLVKNINQNSKRLSQLEFVSSGVAPKFKNVPIMD